MDSEARHPDALGRLRVFDLGIGSERRLHLGGGFACVLAGTRERSAAARWIATTIVGSRSTASDDAIDIASEAMSMPRPQSPLLPLRAPAVLDFDVLRTLWRDDCARRRELMGATHASHRLELQRIDVALERVRALQAPPPAPEGRRDTDVSAFKAAAQAYVRVQTLLAAIDALPPEPSPEALELANAWEANVALLRQRGQLGAPPESDVDPADRGVPVARSPAATGSGAVGREARTELERLHRAVVAAEARIFKRRRGPRRHAVARYNKAVAAERAALARVGVDSYAAFLLGASEHEFESEDRARPAPDEEHAERVNELTARAQQLRARARALLGREPGDDLANDLRALPTDAPARADRIRELADCLRRAGVEVLDDVVGRARVFLESPPSVHIPAAPAWPTPVARSVVPLSEVETLERQRVEEEQLLEEIEVEMLRLDATRDADLARLAPGDFVRVVEAMLDAYRAGEVLEGHLPMVLDGVLDGVDGEVRDAAVLALADAGDVPVIVVTDDAEVTKRISDAGGTIVRWPEPEAPRPAPPPRSS